MDHAALVGSGNTYLPAPSRTMRSGLTMTLDGGFLRNIAHIVPRARLVRAEPSPFGGFSSSLYAAQCSQQQWLQPLVWWSCIGLFPMLNGSSTSAFATQGEKALATERDPRTHRTARRESGRLLQQNRHEPGHQRYLQRELAERSRLCTEVIRGIIAQLSRTPKSHLEVRGRVRRDSSSVSN